MSDTRTQDQVSPQMVDKKIDEIMEALKAASERHASMVRAIETTITELVSLNPRRRAFPNPNQNPC